MSIRPAADAAKRVVQDMPPPGGFPDINFYKQARTRGPTGMQLWFGVAFGMMWGFHRIGVMNRELNEEKYLERQTRYAMATMLQAEEDLWYNEREAELRKREAAIMKDVPEWKVGESVYFSERWVPRFYNPLDRNTKK